MRYRQISIEEQDLSEEEIFSQRLFRVYVLGLPRTGTSMMSGIVERLGVNFIANTEEEDIKAARDSQHVKKYGESYVMNEAFYEIAKDRWERLFDVLSTPYSGCKLIIPVGPQDLALLKMQPSRVVMMWRDPEEVRQSQQASYKGGIIESEEEAENTRCRINEKLCDTYTLLEENNIPVINFKYREVLENPEEKITKLAKFINSDEDISSAVNWVNPEKNRFKEECLTRGI